MASQITRTHIARPTSDVEFERALTRIARLRYASDSFQRYGRKGQAQHGIDVRGFRQNSSDDLLVLQGKCRNPGVFEKEGTLSDSVRQAIAASLKFREFIFCTTAARDTKLQDEAVAMTQELANQFPGENRLVIVWDWDELEEMAHDDVRIYQVLERDPRLSIPLTDLDRRGGMRSGQVVATATGIDTAGSPIDDKDEDGPNGAVLAHIGKTVLRRPRQAMDALDALADGSQNLSLSEQSRRHALRGHAFRAMGRENEAQDAFRAAYALTPDREGSIANYAFVLASEGKMGELRGLMERGLAIHPESETIALRGVEGLGTDEFVPENLRDSFFVRLARHMQRNGTDSPESLLKSARDLLAIRPTDPNAREALADALLQSVLDAPAVQAFAQMDEAQRQRLDEAIDLYASLWTDLVEDSDTEMRIAEALSCNYMLALRLRGDLDAAIDIGTVALPRTHTPQAVAERLLMCRIDRGDTELEGLTDQLDDKPLAQDMRLRLAAATGRWDDVVVMLDELDSVGEATEQGFRDGLRTLAEIRALPAEGRKTAIADLKSRSSTDPREICLWAQLARNEGAFDIAETLLDRAAACVPDTPSDVVRLSVASEAIAQQNTELVYKLLQDFVDYHRDSDLLRGLVRFAAYDYPPRKRGAQVMDRLNDVLGDRLPYLQWRAVFHQQRGEWDIARRLLNRLRTMRSHLSDWYGLYRCAVHLRESARAEALAHQNDLEDMAGDAVDLMRTASILKRHGAGDRALAFGLRAIRDPEGQRSSAVTAHYTTLVMHPPGLDVPVGTTVEPGAYVKLTRDGSDTVLEGIIGGEQDRPWGPRLEPFDRRIAPLMGESVGASIEIDSAGGIQTWRVTEVLPEFLRIARYYASQHEHVFEDARIFTIETVDGDVDPVLRMIREQGAADDALVQTILGQAMPLAFVADQHGMTSLRVAAKLVARGRDLPTTRGFPELHDRAVQVALNARHGVVLDELTVVTAAELGLLPALKARFGSLHIPSVALYGLREHLELKSMDEGEAMSIDAVNGQLYRHIRSAEDYARDVGALKDTLRAIDELCEVEEVIFPDPKTQSGKPDVLSYLIDIAPSVAGCLVLAHQRGVPLLSEDGHLRAWAEGLCSVPGFWLNTALTILAEDEEIKTAELVRASACLSARGHRHHWVTTQLLRDAFDLRSSHETDWMFDQLCTELGGPAASIPSHSAIVARVCAHALEFAPSHVEALRVCTKLFSLCFGQERGARLREWILTLYKFLPSGPATKCLESYCAGHFVDLWDEAEPDIHGVAT